MSQWYTYQTSASVSTCKHRGVSRCAEFSVMGSSRWWPDRSRLVMGRWDLRWFCLARGCAKRPQTSVGNNRNLRDYCFNQVDERERERARERDSVKERVEKTREEREEDEEGKKKIGRKWERKRARKREGERRGKRNAEDWERITGNNQQSTVGA